MHTTIQVPVEILVVGALLLGFVVFYLKTETWDARRLGDKAERWERMFDQERAEHLKTRDDLRLVRKELDACHKVRATLRERYDNIYNKINDVMVEDAKLDG